MLSLVIMPCVYVAGTCDWGYMCDNGECTLTSYDRCDGKRDCSDGSDEQNCLSKLFMTDYSLLAHVLIQAGLCISHAIFKFMAHIIILTAWTRIDLIRLRHSLVTSACNHPR